jgi:hypothetical protein
MQVQDVHQRYFQTSVALSRMQVKNMIPPLEVIAVLSAAKVKFMLAGVYGIAGWMRKPRATQDVDLVIVDRHMKKAIRTLLATYPQLEAQDLEVVVCLRDRESGEVLIDLIKQRELYRETFEHTRTVSEGEQTHLIPSLEMALTMKFAAILDPNRQMVDKYQDAHDFGQMVLQNPEISQEKLLALGDLVYNGGGAELLEMIRRVRAGETLQL